MLAVENIEEYYPIPIDFIDHHDDVFLLRVQGDSMIEAGILDQDFALVRKPTADNGDIVVALIDGEEATIKRFFHEGTYQTAAENQNMVPF